MDTLHQQGWGKRRVREGGEVGDWGPEAGPGVQAVKLDRGNGLGIEVCESWLS